MESPFYPNGQIENGSFSLFLEPILDSYSQKYLQVITLSNIPPGPLASMVKMISLEKISQFVSSNNTTMNGLGMGCTYVLMRYSSNSNVKKESNYMFADDIPAVFSYLIRNGYTVDKGITKMMNGSRVLIGGVSDVRYSGDRKLICFASLNR